MQNIKLCKKHIIASAAALLFGAISVTQAQEREATFKEKYRPQYHFSLPDSWIGDPTGMIYYQGKYYLNYGDGLTTDFVYWQYGKPKFQRRKDISMMSGSAVVDINNTSGFGTKENPPIVAIYSELRHSDIMQFQSISYSIDGGKTFLAYEKNPVIDINNTEFRDPMVFWHKPTNKWIMAVAMAEDTKVRFYNSDNLKDWKFLSDFGPYGARGGVWECPDIFPLPVDGDQNNIKWVLQVGVQPVSGQYFIGDFDGTKFTIDPTYEKQMSYKKYMPVGKVLFDFEEDLKGWKLEGNAFAESPAREHLQNQGAILNKEGNQFINTFHNKDAGTGRALSPEFTISNKYINFLIGGGSHPDKESINLIVNGKAVKSSTGINTETLTWTGWDVQQYKGKKARIEIVDDYQGDFGHIMADHFMQSDELAVKQLEKGPWIDYGPDFYAVRSWNNMKPGDDRRVWIAWMGNWLYAKDVPTAPFKGIQSLPRSLSLKQQTGKYQLVQSPVEELKQLRDKHHHESDITVNGKVAVKEFKPTKNTYELIIEFDLANSTKAGVNLCVGKNQKTTVYFDKATSEIVLDRRNSGKIDFNTSFAGEYRAPLKTEAGKIKLRIFVDESSVEVFGNDGVAVVSALIFPDSSGTGIEIFSEGGKAKVTMLDIWEIKSIWNDNK